MNKSVTFSVIVPVYNIDKYLPRCIDSILSQVYSDFELILIDDGSTDTSGKMCDEFALKDNRIRVFHKQNGGVSSARNVGLDNARGQYIVFVDSDDIVEVSLLHNILWSKADLVTIGFDDYSPSNKVMKSFVEFDSMIRVDTEDGILQFVRFSGYVFVWAKRYSKSIIDKFHIRFYEDMEFSEDILFNNEYIKKINTVENISKLGYHHCHYEELTLGFRTWEYPLVDRVDWRAICHKQFDGFPRIQEYFIKQLLFLVEIEFDKVSNSSLLTVEKAKKLKLLLEHPFVNFCLHSDYNYFRRDVNMLIRLHQYRLLLLRFKN